MKVKHYQTFSEAWTQELFDVAGFGEESSPRGMRTLEKRWSQFKVKDPLTFPVAAEGRSFRDVIGVLEGLSLVGQVSIPETFTSRVKHFGDFVDDGVFHGAYSARMHGMIGEVVHLLSRDPDSRQAIISVYDSARDLNRAYRDIPCTIALHFMLRERKLDVKVMMRSNDMWLGTPYDFTQFAILQATVAQALGCEVGEYIHAADSLHIYERDLARASEIGDSQPSSVDFPLWSPPSNISDMSMTARQLLLAPDKFVATTSFERWAKDLLTR